MRIEITQRDIDLGRKSQDAGELASQTCPVTRGIRRAAKSRAWSVGSCLISYRRHAVMEQPPEVRDWISRFDNEEEVEPFGFDIPDEVLKGVGE